MQANSNSFWSLHVVKLIRCPNDSSKPCIDENLGDALNKHFGRFNQSRDSDIIFSIPELTDSVCIPEINLQSVYVINSKVLNGGLHVVRINFLGGFLNS